MRCQHISTVGSAVTIGLLSLPVARSLAEDTKRQNGVADGTERAVPAIKFHGNWGVTVTRPGKGVLLVVIWQKTMKQSVPANEMVASFMFRIEKDSTDTEQLRLQEFVNRRREDLSFEWRRCPGINGPVIVIYERGKFVEGISFPDAKQWGTIIGTNSETKQKLGEYVTGSEGGTIKVRVDGTE